MIWIATKIQSRSFFLPGPGPSIKFHHKQTDRQTSATENIILSEIKINKDEIANYLCGITLIWWNSF